MSTDTATEEFKPEYWQWGHDADKPRVLHTMIRIKNADASIRFYRDGLGMKVLDRYDFEHASFSIIFLAYEGYEQGGAIELTYNWGKDDDYTHGDGYGHVAIGVPDIHGTVKRLEELGYECPTQPKRMVPGAPHLAFTKDPDGYMIELIETRHNG